ncbi:MAG: DUF2314 domain-containing protein [Fimbriimonas sp.]|nr:DUF2314 domain-containing protein [Fimbriimonas sp.]
MQKKPANRIFVLVAVLVTALLAAVIYLVAGNGRPDVARIAHADPELQAASKQAQGGLPGFIKELQAPKPGEGFAIKGAFKTQAGPEYLWVKSPTYKDGVFEGKLDQVPMAVTGKKKGDTVRVPKKDVFDWLIKDDSGIRGMFTDKVLEKRARG